MQSTNSSDLQVENLPIDIHLHKLLNWLESRRHCEKQWQHSVLAVREKINNAIQDMPAVEEMTKLLSGTHINYFHCLKIVELLKETEASSKNIFGQYSSQRMKDWLDILKLYNQNGLYLAESADMLMKNVKYEIPWLKQRIKQLQQSQDDCAKREVTFGKAAAELQAAFYRSCKEYGIEGKRVKHELVSLIDQLPHHCDIAVQGITELDYVKKAYIDFLNYHFGSQVKEPETCLPMIGYVRNHGNTTTYEWRTGEPPIQIDKPTLNFKFDDEITDTGDDTLDLDIGDELDLTVDFLNDEVVNIDFTIEDSSDGVTLESTTTVKDGVATGSDALLLLENVNTRNKLLDDLHELEAFLLQRLVEMSNEPSVLVLTQLESIQNLTSENLQVMLNDVQKAISQLSSGMLHHLFLIKTSQRYIDRLAENLQQKLWQANKMEQSQKLMVAKQMEALEEQKQLEPKLAIIKKRTKELQTQIEDEISKKYQGRKVNIMGEISNI